MPPDCVDMPEDPFGEHLINGIDLVDSIGIGVLDCLAHGAVGVTVRRDPKTGLIELGAWGPQGSAPPSWLHEEEEGP